MLYSDNAFAAALMTGRGNSPSLATLLGLPASKINRQLGKMLRRDTSIFFSDH
jgi:hypothetical protein